MDGSFLHRGGPTAELSPQAMEIASSEFRRVFELPLGRIKEKLLAAHRRVSLEGRETKVERVLHPSQANPQANRNWEGDIDTTLRRLGRSGVARSGQWSPSAATCSKLGPSTYPPERERLAPPP